MTKRIVNKKKEGRMITKSNVLIDSRYKLSLSEMKLALLIISGVKRSDQDFKTYRIYKKDFIDMLDSKRSGMYSQSKEITETFMSKVLTIQEADGSPANVNFLSYAKHHKNKGFISCRFDKALKPHLLQLQERYTSYDIANILNCRSVYSVRLYEILKSFEGLKKRNIKVEDLRKMLACEKSYKRFYDFKRGVLEVAKKELKKYSDIYFSYELHKQGRYITSITFRILKQKQMNMFKGDGSYRSAEDSLLDAEKVKEIPYDQWTEGSKKSKQEKP